MKAWWRRLMTDGTILRWRTRYQPTGTYEDELDRQREEWRRSQPGYDEDTWEHWDAIKLPFFGPRRVFRTVRALIVIVGVGLVVFWYANLPERHCIDPEIDGMRAQCLQWAPGR